MTVDLAPVPGAAAAAGRILERFRSRKAFFTARLRAADPAGLAPGVAFRVAYVGLDDLNGDDWLISAGRTRLWRVVVAAGASPVAVVEVEQGDDEGWRFVTLNEGPLLQEVNDALAAACAREEFRAGSFEPILLAIPSADMTAIWFRQRDGEGDRLLLVDPSRGTLLEPEAVRDLAQRKARRDGI